MEEGTERKFGIVAFASSGEEDGSLLFVVEVIAESLLESVHVISYFL